MFQLRLIALLTLAYLAMTSNLEPANVLVGVVLAAGVIRLVRPRPPAARPRNGAWSSWALVRYLANLAHAGKSIEHIARRLGKTPEQYLEGVRRFRERGKAA